MLQVLVIPHLWFFSLFIMWKSCKQQFKWLKKGLYLSGDLWCACVWVVGIMGQVILCASILPKSNNLFPSVCAAPTWLLRPPQVIHWVVSYLGLHRQDRFAGAASTAWIASSFCASGPGSCRLLSPSPSSKAAASMDSVSLLVLLFLAPHTSCRPHSLPASFVRSAAEYIHNRGWFSSSHLQFLCAANDDFVLLW